MSADTNQDLFPTPDPEALQADAATTPATERYPDGNQESDVIETSNAQHDDQNVDTPDVDLDDTLDTKLGDRQMIRANLSGH